MTGRIQTECVTLPWTNPDCGRSRRGKQGGLFKKGRRKLVRLGDLLIYDKQTHIINNKHSLIKFY